MAALIERDQKIKKQGEGESEKNVLKISYQERIMLNNPNYKKDEQFLFDMY